jgi:hypothetical protein
MIALCDRTIAALHRRLDRENEVSLARGMPYPTRWYLFFCEFMTVADLYRFPLQHFDSYGAAFGVEFIQDGLPGTGS